MNRSDKENQFLQTVEAHHALISKVCYMYSSGRDNFHDLYQETLANLWQGIDRFRGEANISTWIYRVTLNTCITYFRKNRRHESTVTLDEIYDVAEEISTRDGDLAQMYLLISQLGKLDRAIIMLWLDERSYDEIADITGLSRNNVASRIHRIKENLARRAEAGQ